MLGFSAIASLVQQAGKVLWDNPNFLYREQYQVSRDAASFFDEANPAFLRVALSFSKTLVSRHPGGVLMRSFAASDRFVADVKARKLAPGTSSSATRRSSASAAGMRSCNTWSRPTSAN